MSLRDKKKKKMNPARSRMVREKIEESFFIRSFMDICFVPSPDSFEVFVNWIHGTSEFMKSNAISKDFVMCAYVFDKVTLEHKFPFFEVLIMSIVKHMYCLLGDHGFDPCVSASVIAFVFDNVYRNCRRVDCDQAVEEFACFLNRKKIKGGKIPPRNTPEGLKVHEALFDEFSKEMTERVKGALKKIYGRSSS